MSAMKKTLYEILDLSETASDEEIRAAFSAMQARFATIQGPTSSRAENDLKFAREAVAILTNPERRRLYDHKLANDRFAAEAKRRPTTSDVVHPHDSETQSPHALGARAAGTPQQTQILPSAFFRPKTSIAAGAVTVLTVAVVALIYLGVASVSKKSSPSTQPGAVSASTSRSQGNPQKADGSETSSTMLSSAKQKGRHAEDTIVSGASAQSRIKEGENTPPSRQLQCRFTDNTLASLAPFTITFQEDPPKLSISDEYPPTSVEITPTKLRYTHGRYVTEIDRLSGRFVKNDESGNALFWGYCESVANRRF
jgi:curved DNA-binding protein CbpA